MIMNYVRCGYSTDMEQSRGEQVNPAGLNKLT